MDAYGYLYFFEIYEQNPNRVLQFYDNAVKLDLN